VTERITGVISVKKDIVILRGLAERTAEIAAKDRQDGRRELWSDFNSMKTRRVPVLANVMEPWDELFGEGALECTDALFRGYEKGFRRQIYRDFIGDDYITEPFVTVTPVYESGNPYWETWGFNFTRDHLQKSLAYRFSDSPIKSPEDLVKIVTEASKIDRERTDAKLDVLQDAIGDIIPIVPDCYPPYYRIVGLSWLLAYMLGPEDMMYQFYDRPEMIHDICRTISAAQMKLCDEYEESGLFSNNDLINMGGSQQIQAMAYTRELPNPGTHRTGSLKGHWMYDCAQEFEARSPAMFDEFVIEYQKPIYERFGLTAFGCCENPEHKFRYIKKIKNLRRIAVTPWSDDENCAKLIEDRYVISWRPNPADMVAVDFDRSRITRIIRKAKEIFGHYGCYWEINLKDVITVGHDEERLKKWVELVRGIL